MRLKKTKTSFNITDQIKQNVLSKYKGKFAKELADTFEKQFFPCDPETTPEQYEQEMFEFVGERVNYRNAQRKIRFIFAWYDFWIGLYYDRKYKLLYILPVPFFGIVIKIKK